MLKKYLFIETSGVEPDHGGHLTQLSIIMGIVQNDLMGRLNSELIDISVVLQVLLLFVFNYLSGLVF